MQSASAAQGCAGGPWKLGANAWPQKPQKTNICADRSAATLDDDPVVTAYGIGSVPTKGDVFPPAPGGGQSWLVG